MAGAQILAPIDGTVYRTDAKKGQVVRAGDTLLALADLERLRVRANVDQVDLGRVEPGDLVRITSNAHPGQTWSGRVSELIPNVVVKESRAVAESLTVLDPPVEGLVPGMTVDVEITVAESPETLQVPADAVVSRGGESLVYRLDGSRVRATPVRVGISSVTATEVLEGLSPGDRVVVGGARPSKTERASACESRMQAPRSEPAAQRDAQPGAIGDAQRDAIGDAQPAKDAIGDAQPAKNAIVLEGVAKTYARQGVPVVALRGVDLRISAGEFVAIMGRSGSGKSTLLHILGLLDADYEGRYVLDGVSVSGRSADELAPLRNRMIGFVFQSFHLLPQLTILENAALPALYARDRAPAACRAAARERLEQMGLGDRLEHRPGELSIGQRQRAAIARALVNDPRLLLADEPTGALDSRTADEILEILRRLHDLGATIVMVTHDPEVSAAASRVIQIRDGKAYDGVA